MLGLIRLLLVGFVLFIVLSTVHIIRRLRNPPRRTYASALARSQPGDPSELPAPRPYTPFTFRPAPSAPYELPAWDIPGDRPSGPLIIYTPGWGDSRIGVLQRLFAFAPHASRIIAWDPAGLGDSPATTRCALGTDSDALALCTLALLLQAPKPASPQAPSPHPIILAGSSLGAGLSIVAATLLAREGLAPAAVIAEAPYRQARTPITNYLRLLRLPYRITVPLAMAWFGLTLRRTLDWRNFDRAAHAVRLPCPLLVLHGTLDEICPHDDGRLIAAAAPRNLFISLPGGGHNDLWTDEPHCTQCARAVADFLTAIRDPTRSATFLSATALAQ